jgi:hypothetical protein
MCVCKKFCTINSAFISLFNDLASKSTDNIIVPRCLFNSTIVIGASVIARQEKCKLDST